LPAPRGAFSQRQEEKVHEEVERLRRANPDLEELFHEKCDEPFFIKNLETVQGDERDVILLSIGYGPDEKSAGGNRLVAMRFGPLNRVGGERRLNVAITRARERMVVVSSIRAQDIDLSKTDALGVRLLRDYLDYAERGVEALRAGITEDSVRGFDSDFERDVHEELTRHGLKLHTQVGCTDYRIDLAAVDPRAPGRYLLGIECDGATYHTSATARDRDRLRQEVLENLGWQICRVWSTDWLRDRNAQVRRVMAAFQKAAQAKLCPASPSSPKQAAGIQVSPNLPDPSIASLCQPTGQTYGSIEDVPEKTLVDVVTTALRLYGATSHDDLIQAAARQLGFKRTGNRIYHRINHSVEGLIRIGKVRRTEDKRLQLTEISSAANQ
jgi:very-short-patch-repair endonuclease